MGFQLCDEGFMSYVLRGGTDKPPPRTYRMVSCVPVQHVTYVAPAVAALLSAFLNLTSNAHPGNRRGGCVFGSQKPPESVSGHGSSGRAGVNGHHQNFVMRVSQEQGMRSRSQPDHDTTHTRRTTHASQYKYTIRHSRPHTRVGLLLDCNAVR
jgi:hypothetical protein